MENVKATAADATDHVKAEGQGAVADVKDQGRGRQGQRPAGLTPQRPGRPTLADALGRPAAALNSLSSVAERVVMTGCRHREH